MPVVIILVVLIGLLQSWLMWFAPLPNVAEIQQQQSTPYRIEIVEPYAGEFRILAKQRYPSGMLSYVFDTPTFEQLSGLDLALGWGQMSRPEIYQTIDIRQSNRWYRFQVGAHTPLRVDEISQQSANTHMLAANARIAKQLQQLDVDDLVLLKGQLVNLYLTDGRYMKSSLSREDTGAGACEIFLVQEVMLKASG